MATCLCLRDESVRALNSTQPNRAENRILEPLRFFLSVSNLPFVAQYDTKMLQWKYTMMIKDVAKITPFSGF